MRETRVRGRKWRIKKNKERTFKKWWSKNKMNLISVLRNMSTNKSEMAAGPDGGIQFANRPSVLPSTTPTTLSYRHCPTKASYNKVLQDYELEWFPPDTH